ncbi:MAG: hypothetical protein GC168_13495 [Candidatus Hydrogenedens sp.]|nr:hypothetical protein [Candidatus Hydrogenedens sp.]
MRKSFWQSIVTSGVLALVSAGTAAGQTTVFSETWEGAAGPFPQVVNGSGGAVALGQTFQADNLWTTDPDVTVAAGTGPHVAISLVDDAGDKKLEWNADGLNGADNDVAFNTPIATPFTLDDIDSFTVTVDIEVRDVGTNGGRDSTFYVGADFQNYFAVQLVTRDEVGGEVIEVEWARDGADNDVKIGDGATYVGGGQIVPGGRYILEATFAPGDPFIALSVSLTDTDSSSVILDATHDIPAAEAPLADAVLDLFTAEGKRRMFHTWGDVSVEIVPAATSEGEGEETGLVVDASGVATQTREVGGTATFSVSATGNTGSLSYQWFEGTPAKVSESIPGATASSLTLSNLALEMSGTTYYCAVTDDLETVNSPLFTLIVVGTPLPVAGGLGIAALSLLTAAAGARALRRK